MAKSSRTSGAARRGEPSPPRRSSRPAAVAATRKKVGLRFDQVGEIEILDAALLRQIYGVTSGKVYVWARNPERSMPGGDGPGQTDSMCPCEPPPRP